MPSKTKKISVRKPGKSHKSLVIVESPSKAKTINKFLGKDFHVEASMGHVRDLPKSKMGVDLEKDFEPHYVIPTKAKKTVTKLKKAAENKATVYLAPDPDREGEAISWHLATIFQANSPSIKRVEFNEITRDAVKKAFEHPRDIDLNLVNAQQARRIMDRIVGYILSPLLWEKVGSGLSAGRVQSVALRLIVERERDVLAFKPEEYWSIVGVFSSQREQFRETKFLAKLEKIKNEKIRIPNRDNALALKEVLEKENFRVVEIEERERRRRPTAPFITSKLQQESYTKLGFTAAKTMQLAQKLYEGVDLGQEEGTVGLITYMRTDSVRVADYAIDEARKFIRETYGEDYLSATPNIYKTKKSAQDAHEAIRPTSAARTPDRVKSFLDRDTFRLYQLVWCKFVASQMTESIDKLVTVIILGGTDYSFRATGFQNIFPGFGIVYDQEANEALPENGNGNAKEGEEEDKDEKLSGVPPLVKGEELLRHEIRANQHFTKPPARYNDASLVKVLEENGIGRPSTYAPIIYTLLSRHYVERKASALAPTEIGEIVTDLLLKHFPRIVDYDFTAAMEAELDKVEEGSLEWTQALKEFYDPFSADVAAAKETMKDMKKELVVTEYKCDLCAKPLVIRFGRFGKFLACSGFPDCRYTRSIPTGFRCPLEGCDGEIVQRRSKRGMRFYGCSKYPQCRYLTNKLPKPPEPGAQPEGAVAPPENG